MGFTLALKNLWPTDPAYAPFGCPCLRGLGTLPLATGAALAVLWRVQDFLLRRAAPTDVTRGSAAQDALQAWDAVLVFVALMPMLLLAAAAVNMRRRGPGAAAAALAAVLIGASLFAGIYPPLSCNAHGLLDDSCVLEDWQPHWYHLQLFMRVSLWGGLLTMVLHLIKSEHESVQAGHTEQVRALRVRREEAEARLQSLQAQIEPHFLFNTLAHVQRLHATDLAAGQAMLRSLTDYMEAALPQMREPLGTLSVELALVRAYIHVQQVRMGERLQFREEVAPEVLDALVPPVSVLTLAENAIKHGLGPKGGGGTLTVAAREHGGELMIDVIDDGVGLRAAGGHGRGLSNTRARLETLFGPGAGLTVAGCGEGGVCASMRLPFRRRRPT